MKAEFIIGNINYVIEQSQSGKTYKLFENGEAIFLSESLTDVKEAMRTRGLRHLQEVHLKAKDDWYRLAYGYPELFLKGAVQKPFNRPFEETILLPDLSIKTECNCYEVDPHNCKVHGLDAMKVKEEA